MATQTRTIRVVVDTKQAQGLKRLSDQFGKMNRSIKSVQTNIGGLSRLFQIALAGFGVREIVQSADAFQLLRDRIKVFTGSAQAANQVFGDIVNLAARTRSSVESFAEAYNRVAIATQSLGLTSNQTLGVVTALQQSLRLSGASAQEANSVFIQLSQALSLGRLQGQELRAVLLSNATVANLLAKEFGVTTGQLKELGEQGRITSDRVIKALADNFDELNNKAGKLGTTFQQGTIVAFDQLRVKIDQLNQKFDINSKFFKGIEFLIENLEQFLKVIATIVGTALILKLGAQINVLSANIQAAIIANGSLLNAFGLTRLATIALAAAFAYFSVEALTDWNKFQLSVKKNLLELRVAFAEFDTFIYETLNDLASVGGSFNPLSGVTKGIKVLGEVRLNKLTDELGKVTFELNKLEKQSSVDSPDNIISKISKELAAFSGKQLNVATGEFAKLNQELRDGIITLDLYNQEIEELQIKKLTEQFQQGKITVEQYNAGLLKLRTTFDGLSTSDQVFVGIVAGARDANREIGSLAQEVSNVTRGAFNQLEDRLFDFIKTGKFEFKDFVQAVLDDLTRVAIRLSVIRALTQATGLAAGGGGAFANGGVFRNGKVQPYANGGVVTRPTIFPMANGTGLMGEAGPEAILPLKRGPGGKLGVEAGGGGTVVNVINNSRGDVQTSESTGPNGEKQIEVLILDKVKRAITEGKMDKTMQTTYGLRRRGN